MKILLSVILFISFCIKAETIFYPTLSESVKGHVILSHGLNLNPLRMVFLAQYFNSLGYDASVVVFKGHTCDSRQMKNVVADDWRDDYILAFKKIKNEFPHQKIINVGFSLGALVSLDQASKLEAELGYPPFSANILLAPAIEIRFFSKVFMELLKGLQQFNLSVPSLNNPAYTCYSHTSTAAYLALKDLLESLDKRYFFEVPTLIIGDYKDELVNMRKLKRRTKEQEDVTFLNLIPNKEILLTI